MAPSSADYEEPGEFISEEQARAQHIKGPNAISSGSKQSFACPGCGSYNTEESVYYEKCNTCGWCDYY